MKSVLLVEDVTFSRAIMARTIQSIEPCAIFEAETGQQAFEAMRNHSDFDVIIADLSMPLTNGLELLKTVRAGKSPAARDIPFIIISGALTEPIQQVLVALDITAAISKPATKDDLAKALDKVGVEKRSLRSIADYEAVHIAGLLDVSPGDKLSHTNLSDDFDALVSFLVAAPILADLSKAEVEILARRIKTVHYPENTIINGDDFGETQLPLITWGEAEILQSAQLPDGEVVEHRVVLLEVGNLLGTFNFMSPPSDFKHPKVRTTRPTEVIILDFEDDDSGSEMNQIRDKVKVSIGKILSQRITYSDKALAISLTHQLAETRIKRTAGGYVIMMICLLGMYTLAMRGLVDSDLKGVARSISSIVMILIFLAPLIGILRNGPIKAFELGLTFRGARAAAIDAMLLSSLLLGLLIGLKYLIVSFVPAYQGMAVFELAQVFAQTTPTGGVDWTFYGIIVFVYILFVPAQEIIARCGLQSLLDKFLYGSDVRRAVTAILASNIVFAAAHSHLNVGFAAVTFLGGLFFGWLFYRHRSIIGVSIAHIMVGGTALFVLGLESFLK